MKELCEECKIWDMRQTHPYRPQHRLTCSKASIYDFKCWLEIEKERNSSLTKQLKIQTENAARWEGKYRIIKHENNKLRKKNDT